MSKDGTINWAKLSAIAICLGVLPFIAGYLRDGFAIADTPAQQKILADRLYLLETNTTEQFRRNNWHNEEVDKQLGIINEKLDVLIPASANPAPAPIKGQDQNNK